MNESMIECITKRNGLEVASLAFLFCFSFSLFSLSFLFFPVGRLNQLS